MLFNTIILEAIPKPDRKKASEVFTALSMLSDFVHKNAKKYNSLQYRCHSLSRAICSNIKGLELRDGSYLGLLAKRNDPRSKQITYQISHCDHSWLTTKQGTIIDPYPVGCLNISPLVVPKTPRYASFGYSLYVENAEGRKAATTPEFLREARKLTKILEIALKQKPA